MIGSGADMPVGEGSSDAGLAARLGIFARTFRRRSAEEVAHAVIRAGYALAHWNFAALGLSTLAVDVTDEQFSAVRAAFYGRGIAIPSVSATFNATHPDSHLRALWTAQAVRLIGLAPELGAGVVTLCTGTRDPQDMWRPHPDNTSPAAWADLRRTLDPLLEAARTAGICLGVEPEPANVVADAPTAARLLDELGRDAPVGIVLDPANLLTPQTVGQQSQILAEAVDLVGDRVVGVQAKDVVAAGYGAAGVGLMDFPDVFAHLARIGPVPVIVQDAAEADAARIHADLLRWHRAAAALGSSRRHQAGS